jgi:hypothetical protein
MFQYIEVLFAKFFYLALDSTGMDRTADNEGIGL